MATALIGPSRSGTAAVRARKSSSSWVVNVDAVCVCERVPLQFAWYIDGLAIVGSAWTLVYHRVTVVVVGAVLLGVERVDAIVVVVVVQEGQGKINKRRKKRTMKGWSERS